jgi:hypothetical protein
MLVLHPFSGRCEIMNVVSVKTRNIKGRRRFRRRRRDGALVISSARFSLVTDVRKNDGRTTRLLSPGNPA